MKNLKSLIHVATGKEQADLIVHGAHVLNVFTKEFEKVDLALCGEYIAAVGKRGTYSGKIEIDCTGKYIVPGFIDSHVHIESSMLLPSEFMRTVLPCGTTTVIADSHEIANVVGADGIRFMMNESKNAQGNVFFMIPSCVPATDFEHTGGKIDTKDISKLLDSPEVLGLGEMMNYPGVLSAQYDVLEKIYCVQPGIIDGHAPLVTEKNLQAYRSTGIKTDHECRTFAEALEKIKCGMWILLREGSSARDLEHIIPELVNSTLTSDRFAFCTDDKNAMDILKEGHIDHCIRTAIKLGIPVEEAYCMASLHAAQCYELRDIGALCAGYKADFVILDNPENVSVRDVYCKGKAVSTFAKIDNNQKEQTTANFMSENSKILKKVLNSVHIKKIHDDMFAFRNTDSSVASGNRHVIKISEGTLNTEALILSASDAEKRFHAGDLCKVVVVERHKKTGHSALCFLSGYGLNKGAIACSIAHDSHNIICIGANTHDMKKAVEHIKHMQGGICIVHKGHVKAHLNLAVAGLMSTDTAENVAFALQKMQEEVSKLGVYDNIEPFVTMSFLALPVIPELRITDQGLFNVDKQKFEES
ncbi:MAG: adenine deaminase [Spirochaetales bacterium]